MGENQQLFHRESLELKIDLLTKLSDLEANLSKGKSKLTASLFELKRNEREESQYCKGCKGFCRINH